MPPVTLCLTDLKAQMYHCKDHNGNAFDCAFENEECANEHFHGPLVAMPVDDYGTLLNYCANLKK
jgi:hypothetical protein